jgi:hypothetical protein
VRLVVCNNVLKLEVKGTQPLVQYSYIVECKQ